jgi:hypothetical protein
VEGQETCQLPDDPTLAELAAALNDAGYWAIIVDGKWRTLYMTDALRLTRGGLLELVPFTVGLYLYGPEALTALLAARGGVRTLEGARYIDDDTLNRPGNLGGREGGPTPDGRGDIRRRLAIQSGSPRSALRASSERVRSTRAGVT